MNFDKIFVFTDFDLDGTTSLLALHWALGAKPGQISFKSTTVSNFRREYLNWLNEHKPDAYEKIYILDLDVSNSIDLVDRSNFIIIDHHLTHVKAAKEYKNASIHVIESTSCAKLLYSKFTPKITTEQKLLIALANDYDSYALTIPQSYELNCLLTNMQKSAGSQKAEKFMTRFYDGFKGFNAQEANIIKEHVTLKNKTISELQVFTGSVPIGGKPRSIYGATGNKFINEICDHLIKKYNAEIVFFVNTDASHVSFRKSKQCEVDLSKLAAKLCEGGGHEYAAGGKITESFMSFTKLLTPL
ncbi:MAG: hypothetical protein EBR30_00580 [Cytophagia bacterium]|nr:hypothetical protein [Cytophagia bacterium]